MLLRRAALCVWVAVLHPRPARAIEYEVFVDIETEEDLYDLWVTGQISERSFDALLLLYQTRVDLNRAGRERLYLLPNLDYSHVDGILEHRARRSTVRELGELVAAGVLSTERADALRPFVIVRAAREAEPKPAGLVRLLGRWSGRHDRLPPAAAIQARVQALGGLDAGAVGVLTRNRLRRVRWDAAREGFSAEPEAVRFELPKAYLAYESDTWEVVGGTYRIGFGQRLTFDVTNQATPNGAFGDYELRRTNELGLRCKRGAGELSASPCPRNPVARVTPDFQWTNRLTGVAAGVKRAPLGTGWLQAYAWGSMQVHRAQSVELVNALLCADPRLDDASGCRAPPVFVRGRDPRAPAPTASYATLPAVVGEGVAGAHLGYFWNARMHVGFTGYGAVPRWRLSGVALDFQEIARKPFGGPFGAVGVQAALGFRHQDFFAELTRSFDSQVGGGGGFGLIVRSVTSIAGGELDVSLRFYATELANPYARPISAPDELDGLRARDEAGVRVRGAFRIGPRVGVRMLLDGWRRLSTGGLHGLVFGRADASVTDRFTWSWWVEHRSVRSRTLLATQLACVPVERFSLSTQLQVRWSESSEASKRPQRDLAAVLVMTIRPVDLLRLRLRARYDLEDLRNNHRLPHTAWAYFDASLTVRERDVLRARYDFRIFLDERESTALRVPNPEHWLSLEYVFRY